MALIKKGHLHQIQKDRIYVHKTTESTYSIFYEDGKKIFQIDTYGSENRKMKNKVSQSIQLDEESALDLIDILTKEFVL